MCLGGRQGGGPARVPSVGGAGGRAGQVRVPPAGEHDCDGRGHHRHELRGGAHPPLRPGGPLARQDRPAALGRRRRRKYNYFIT